VGTRIGTYAIEECTLTVKTNRIPHAQPFGSVTWATSVGGRKVGSLIHRIDTLRFLPTSN